MLGRHVMTNFATDTEWAPVRTPAHIGHRWVIQCKRQFAAVQRFVFFTIYVRDNAIIATGTIPQT